MPAISTNPLAGQWASIESFNFKLKTRLISVICKLRMPSELKASKNPTSTMPPTGTFGNASRLAGERVGYTPQQR